MNFAYAMLAIAAGDYTTCTHIYCTIANVLLYLCCYRGVSFFQYGLKYMPDTEPEKETLAS